jgi:hypothetical protein
VLERLAHSEVRVVGRDVLADEYDADRLEVAVLDDGALPQVPQQYLE